jgi:hypothetical protein
MEGITVVIVINLGVTLECAFIGSLLPQNVSDSKRKVFSKKKELLEMRNLFTFWSLMSSLATWKFSSLVVYIHIEGPIYVVNFSLILAKG